MKLLLLLILVDAYDNTQLVQWSLRAPVQHSMQVYL